MTEDCSPQIDIPIRIDTGVDPYSSRYLIFKNNIRAYIVGAFHWTPAKQPIVKIIMRAITDLPCRIKNP